MNSGKNTNRAIVSKELFWCLKKPEFRDDYKSVKRNGIGRYPFKIPTVACDKCDAFEYLHGGGLLPHVCPRSCRKLLRECGVGPLPPARHKTICRKVALALRDQGFLGRVFPGDSLLPVEVQFASMPVLDFMWPCAGTILVQRSVRLLLEKHAVTGINFIEPVVYETGISDLGKQKARVDDGEPESIIVGHPRRRSLSHGRICQLVASEGTEWHLADHVESECEVCGQLRRSAGVANEQVMRTSIPSSDIFCLSPGSSLIVTDRVRRLLIDAQCSNVDFELVRVLDDRR